MTTTSRPAVTRPSGPAADVSSEITAAGAAFLGAATPANFAAAGYEEHEYIATGTATSYASAAPLTADGLWNFTPDATAAYRTRIVVRRPAKAEEFNGTVLVEWLNVSGGIDANPDYTSLEEEILRSGAAWVGVSAQLIGVSGGPVLVTAPGGEGIAGKGLKALDPNRYASLEHPGDGYSFDMFTQIARALRQGGNVLGGATPERLFALGESQSAIALTTYYNGVQPLTKAFDAFFIHSRASVSLPLVGPGKAADLAGSFGGVDAVLRPDVDAPALELQAESDLDGVLKSLSVRQPDTDRFRLWEVAGTAHADRHLLGAFSDSANCGLPINDAPFHIVAKAALRGLERWVRTGEAPPVAPRIEVTEGAVPTVRRDDDGIALGGIRTPPVDVPVEVLSGKSGPSGNLFCMLLGSTTPLSPERLAALYSSRSEYETRFGAATDAAVKAGFVLEEDRQAMGGYSRPERVSSSG